MISLKARSLLSFSSKKFFFRQLSFVEYDRDSITVDLGNHEPSIASFKTVFLRDSCNSPESVDISTRQKSFTTAEIVEYHEIAETPIVVNNGTEQCLQVKWILPKGSIHVSNYAESFLKKYSTLPARMKGKFFPEDQIFWTDNMNAKSLEIDYKEYLENQSQFKNAVNNLNKYGMCFVTNIDDPLKNPETQTMTPKNTSLWPVAKLAERFGYIKETFYGKLFDVRNEKDAKNIANTNVFLPLHMDLCYYESPPGLQFLHFIKNSTLGGENVFCDSFAAVKYLRETDIDAYDALKKVPLTFHYDNNGEYYYYLRPLIVEDPYIPDFATGKPKIKEVNYSPPFQGNFEFGAKKDENPALFENFMRGMVKFEKFVNNPKNQFIAKTPENSCVIFDNRRILHSRLQFSDSNGGDRWLMGCYVDGDSFRSKLRTLNR